MKPINKNNKPVSVSTKDQFNYIEYAKAYNESLTDIDPAFTKINPTNRKLVVKCLTSPQPIQMRVRTNESTNATQAILHPEPLMPIGVVVSVDPATDYKVGDFVQFPINYVISQESLNVPNKYIMPFSDQTYGYVILDSHSIQCKLTELPKFDYPTISLETNDEN